MVSSHHSVHSPACLLFEERFLCFVYVRTLGSFLMCLAMVHTERYITTLQIVFGIRFSVDAIAVSSSTGGGVTAVMTKSAGVQASNMQQDGDLADDVEHTCPHTVSFLSACYSTFLSIPGCQFSHPTVILGWASVCMKHHFYSVGANGCRNSPCNILCEHGTCGMLTENMWNMYV